MVGWLVERAAKGGRAARKSLERRRRPDDQRQQSSQAAPRSTVWQCAIHSLGLPYSVSIRRCTTAAPQATGWRRADTGPELLLALAATRQALHGSPPPFPPTPPPPPPPPLETAQRFGWVAAQTAGCQATAAHSPFPPNMSIPPPCCCQFYTHLPSFLKMPFGRRDKGKQSSKFLDFVSSIAFLPSGYPKTSHLTFAPLAPAQ